MMTSTSGAVSRGTIPATADGLRTVASCLRTTSWAMLFGAAAWSAWALVTGIHAIEALRLGDRAAPVNPLAEMPLHMLAMTGVGIAFAITRLKADAVSAIAHPRWRELSSSARNWQVGAPFFLPCTFVSLFRFDQLCRWVATTTGDEKLTRLCDEVRRSLWVLLAETAGLPVIWGLLLGKGLEMRFMSLVAALVMAMTVYVLSGMFRAARRAAAVLTMHAEGATL